MRSEKPVHLDLSESDIKLLELPLIINLLVNKLFGIMPIKIMNNSVMLNSKITDVKKRMPQVSNMIASINRRFYDN